MMWRALVGDCRTCKLTGHEVLGIDEAVHLVGGAGQGRIQQKQRDATDSRCANGDGCAAAAATEDARLGKLMRELEMMELACAVVQIGD